MNRYVKGALFGAIGGVAATFILGKVMGAMSRVSIEKNKKRKTIDQPITRRPLRTNPELRAFS
jgi:hypothetical protein